MQAILNPGEFYGSPFRKSKMASGWGIAKPEDVDFVKINCRRFTLKTLFLVFLPIALFAQTRGSVSGKK